SLVSHFVPGAFYTGKVVSLSAPGKDGIPGAIELSFGASRAEIAPAAIQPFMRNWNMHETGSAELPAPAVRAEILRRHFQPGSMVLCAVPYAYSPAGRVAVESPPELEIAQRPLIQGGAQILRDGKVLANVGGFENT